MSIRDRMNDPRLIRDINCGILDGLKLRHGLALGHLLLVESDPKTQRRIGGILRRAGYHVTIAATREESLQAAQRDDPDLIVADIVLAGHDGLGVLAALRTRAESVKIAAFCGNAGFAQHLEAALSFGADEVVAQPSDPATLLGAIRDLLELPDRRPASRPHREERSTATG